MSPTNATSIGAVAYATSKGGLSALTRALALELAEFGTRVNAILPGAIETAMLQPAMPEDIDLRLLQRAGSLHGSRGPEVCADLIAFLVSDEAEHISGEEIRIDGAALA